MKKPWLSLMLLAFSFLATALNFTKEDRDLSLYGDSSYLESVPRFDINFNSIDFLSIFTSIFIHKDWTSIFIFTCFFLFIIVSFESHYGLLKTLLIFFSSHLAGVLALSFFPPFSNCYSGPFLLFYGLLGVKSLKEPKLSLLFLLGLSVFTLYKGDGEIVVLVGVLLSFIFYLIGKMKKFKLYF